MKLALGTAQFGMNYGIANLSGQTPESEVAVILNSAAQAGLRVIDTAHLYGESESVLGRTLPYEHPFHLVTKTPKFAPTLDARAIETALNQSFALSLARLHHTQIYGLLVHHSGDLLAPNGSSLWQGLQRLREEGRVQRIGASVYSSEQIDALLQRYPLDLVQLPLSILDQRLIRSGHLARLADRGIEIHARSTFLQGALLMDPTQLPPQLAALKSHLARLRETIEAQSMNMLEAALRFVIDRPEITAVICGVDRHHHLQELIAAARSGRTLSDPERWAFDDVRVLDPSQWINP